MATMTDQQVEEFWLKVQNYGEPFKRCPLGGYCFNPLCMLGCIEKVFS